MESGVHIYWSWSLWSMSKVSVSHRETALGGVKSDTVSDAPSSGVKRQTN